MRWMRALVFFLAVSFFGLVSAFAVCPLAQNAAGEYLVGSYDDLKQVGEGDCPLDLSAGYRLTANINAGSSVSENCDDAGVCAGFDPIGSLISGRDSSEGLFNVAFHGGGHVIDSLYIYLPDSLAVGFFAIMGEDAVVDSLTLTHMRVTGKACVGGMMGDDMGARLEWVSVEGNIRGGDLVGGFAGAINGIVVHGRASGTVTGSRAVGGFVGSADGDTLEDSYASGEVSGTMEVGGLAGRSYMPVRKCGSEGSVSGDHDIGGLVGSANDSITDSWSTANVFGSYYVGGLVGSISRGVILRSFARGAVKGDSEVGGFVGYCSRFIDSCYATGSVTGDSLVGGFAGTVYAGINDDEEKKGTITNSYATGNVTGNSGVGGFIGYHRGEAITNAYATGKVHGIRNDVGGFAGIISKPLWNSYATGAVEGDTNVGGFGGLNSKLLYLVYAAGHVQGKANIGGVMGRYSAHAWQSVHTYWDTLTSSVSKGLGYIDYSVPAATLPTGLPTSEMKNSTFLKGMSFGDGASWIILEGRSYPGIRSVDNAPFAFSDRWYSAERNFSLDRFLGNDYDIETLQANLVLCVDSISTGSTDSMTTFSFPASAGEGDSAQIRYRVGEVREAEGDTLWGNEATSVLLLSDSTYSGLSASKKGSFILPRIQAVPGGIEFSGIRGKVELYNMLGMPVQNLYVTQDGVRFLSVHAGVYLVRHAGRIWNISVIP